MQVRVVIALDSWLLVSLDNPSRLQAATGNGDARVAGKSLLPGGTRSGTGSLATVEHFGRNFAQLAGATITCTRPLVIEGTTCDQLCPRLPLLSTK